MLPSRCFLRKNPCILIAGSRLWSAYAYKVACSHYGSAMLIGVIIHAKSLGQYLLALNLKFSLYEPATVFNSQPSSRLPAPSLLYGLSWSWKFGFFLPIPSSPLTHITTFQHQFCIHHNPLLITIIFYHLAPLPIPLA